MVLSYTPAEAHRLGFERSMAMIGDHYPSMAPDVRRIAGALLRGTLEESGQSAAWTKNSLNVSGAPLELSFSTLSGGIRYTTEVGAPSMPAAKRWERIHSLASELGWGEASRETAREFPGLQAGPLEWGAWLGVRHDAGGGAPAYKMYLETPEGGSVRSLMREYPIDMGAAPLMVGKSPGSQRCEFYFEMAERGITIDGLRRLLANVGLEDRLGPLADLVRSCDICPGPTPALKSVQYGFSYSVRRDRKAPVFSLFADSAEFFGGDGIARRQILAAAYSREWSLGMYPLLSEPFSQQFLRAKYHNTISFVVDESPAAGLQISLSPPPGEAGEED